MPKARFAADHGGRNADARRADASARTVAALLQHATLAQPPRRPSGAERVTIRRRILTAAALSLLAGALVWLQDAQPGNYWRLHREALQELSWVRDQPDADPLALFSGSLADISSVPARTVRGTVYVPAYAALREKAGQSRIAFSTTLSIHNTSPDQSLVLERIDYHNTEGALVQRHLDRAVALKPYGTIEIFVARDDVRAGAGANFVVHWAAAGPATPMIEAVMLGSSGGGTYAFVSQGRAVAD